MAIQITCPGCQKRFSVSDKFAGQQGPCPSCKEIIKIPKPTPTDDVVIHAPEHSEQGAVGTGGKHVLKTSRRLDTRFQPLLFTAVAGAVLVVLFLALVMRGRIEGMVAQGVAAAVLGPALAWAGYTFLRDAELEPYRGTSLIVRSVVCGLVYALLWGVYVFLGEQVFGDKSFDTPLLLETWQMLVLAAAVCGIGTFAAYVSFDLDPAVGFFHFAMFLAVTVLLRWIVDLPVVPGLSSG